MCGVSGRRAARGTTNDNSSYSTSSAAHGGATPVSRAILPDRPDNSRAALNSPANALQQQQEARSKTPVWLIAVLRLCLPYSHSCSCVFYFKNWICCGMRGSPGHRVGGRANPSRRGAHRRRCRIPLFARHIHLGGSLVSRMLVMLATPMIDLSFDRLQQRCFTLEMRDADLRSPME
jgi:hypothetical protein